MEDQNNPATIKLETNLTAPKNPQNIMSRLNITPRQIKYGIIILAVLAISLGGYYWYAISQRIYSDKAEIFAPLIILGPGQPSVLQKIMVKDGEQISANQVVARLEGGEFVRAQTDGTVVSINDQVGKLFSPGLPIVTMLNPDDLRLIVHVAENKGLNSVRVGQKVVFTVDAFGARKFDGQVEEISQTSDQSSVVFSISDKRDEKYFSVKVKFDNYPELLNGMSAKAWIYK